jgi:hypothetical protein
MKNIQSCFCRRSDKNRSFFYLNAICFDSKYSSKIIGTNSVSFIFNRDNLCTNSVNFLLRFRKLWVFIGSLRYNIETLRNPKLLHACILNSKYMQYD